MTKFDYAAIATDVSGILAEFGMPLTLRMIRNASDYSPDTGIAQTTLDFTRNGVIVDYALAMVGASGGLIQSNDRRCLLEAVGAAIPEPGDEIIQGTDTYAVIRVAPTAPAGVPVVYDLQVRG